jgi:DNA-binding transcriptional LysR family regulator
LRRCATGNPTYLAIQRQPIAELKRRYPLVQLDVSSSGFERMMHRLRNGSVDVVLGLHPHSKVRKEGLMPLIGWLTRDLGETN